MLSDKEVLQACITKAIEGGWQSGNGTLKFLGVEGMATLVLDDGIEKLIYNHEFAKALWPKNHCKQQDELNYDDHMRWVDHHLYHESEMVISDNPIAYLRENA